MDITLKDKVAIVTGSTRGIGRATALLLAQAGALVFINGRDKTRMDEALGYFDKNKLKVYGVVGDVSDENFVKNFIASVNEQAGRIDILVNNAGGSEWKLLEELTTSYWDQSMNHNLKSAFLMSREVSAFMKRGENCKIINIVSTAALKGRSGGAHYIAAKSGLIGLTKALAKELGKFSIQVNAVAPGLTNSDLSRGVYTDEIFYKVASVTPLKRLADPEDIAKTVLFLSSSLADFITGQVLIVDGGLVTENQ